MATTTTPDNIYVLESSDPDEPLAWQPAMATSVQNALNSRALQTFRWANATERNAQVGMREGDMGIQEDTDATYQYDTVTPNAWGQVLPVVVPPLPGRVIASGSFTAQSSVAIDGLSGADRYEVVLNSPTASTGNTISFRLRSGGVPNTASQYYRVRVSGTGSAASANTVSAADQSGSLFISGTTQDKLVILNIHSLNDALRTVLEMRSSGSSAPGSEEVNEMTIWHRGATALDGIEFNASSGTITGTYVVRAW